MRRVQIFDTTLRDGEQSPGISLSVEEKVEIAHQLARLKVDVIEAGFPITSEGDFEAVSRIAEEVKGPAITGLSRLHEGDIERAWEAVQWSGRPRVHTFVGTSDLHIEHQMRSNREEILRRAGEAVRFAKSLCPEVEFSPMDATRTDVGYLAEVVAAAVEAGADVINIADTVGYTTPPEFAAFLKELQDRVPGLKERVLSVHCHDGPGDGGRQQPRRGRGRGRADRGRGERHRGAGRQRLARRGRDGAGDARGPLRGRGSGWRPGSSPTPAASSPT